MKRTTAIKIMLCVLIVAFALGCFFACGKKSTYNVVFMDGDKVISSTTVEPGNAVTLPTPSKEGATFVGWYSDAELTQAYVEDSEVNENLILYAKFSQRALSISVNSNGGSEVEKVSVTTGSSYTVPTPTREGYEFAGYTYIDENNDEKTFSLTGTYDLKTNIRLTAHWSIVVNKVIFMNGDQKVTEVNVNYGDKMAILPTATKVGHSFAGWFSGETELTTETQIKNNLTVNAAFSANTYFVSFDKNGGDNIADQTVTYGENYSFADPNRTGYQFVGFTYNGEEFDSQGIYNFDGSIRLIANWEIKHFTVTFLDKDTEEQIGTQTVDYNAGFNEVPAATGYEITGYYLDKDGSAINVAGYKVTDNTTVYVSSAAKTFTINVNGLDNANQTISYGSIYTLPQNPEREGYDFRGYFVKDSTDAYIPFDYTGRFDFLNNIIVFALFDPIEGWGKVTITICDINDVQIANSIVIDKGNVIDLTGINTNKLGYDWDGWYYDKDGNDQYSATDTFDTDDVVYALYSPHTYTIYINANLEGVVATNVSVRYKEAYQLSALEKRGYTFNGFTYNNEPFSLTGSSYNYADSITVNALWTRNEVTVTFLNDDNGTFESKNIYQYEILKDNLPDNNPPKTGYHFEKWVKQDGSAYDYEAEIEANITLKPSFLANTYTITYGDNSLQVTYGQAYELPESLSKEGYIFGGYTYNNNVFPRTGTYTYTDDITVVINWEDDTDLFEEISGQSYFREKASVSDPYTYVFLKGVTYSFGNKALSSSANGSLIFIYPENDVYKFRADGVGTFNLTVTPEQGETSTISCKIVEYVNAIDTGSDYQSMIANGQNSNVYQRTTTQTDYVMDIGYNNFIPDISIGNLSHDSLTLEDANIDLKIYENGSLIDVDYSLEGNVINLDSSLATHTIKIEFVPKYGLSNNHLSTPSMTLKVNNGVNVYDSLGLRNSYSNLGVHQINILRNIKAELIDTDYVAGHGKQIGNITLDVGGNTEVMENVDLGRPINNFGKGVYARSSVAGSNDSIVVNGNYFTIDGSKLPYVYDTTNRTAGMGYAMSNTQIGIFLYRSLRTDPGTSPETTYDDQTYRSNDGHAIINNLRISGNNLYSAQATQSGIDELPFLKMSSAYIGMVVRGGTVNLDNVAITNVGLGVMLHGGISGYYMPGIDATYGGETGRVQDVDEVAVKFSMTDCSIKNAWCNDIYTFDLAEVNLIGTQLNGCSGAALHFDNRPYGGTQTDSLGYTNCNITLNMDIYSASHINNWVSGTEPWFVAYNKTTAASQIKAGFEEALNPNGLTIIKNMLGAEMMNLAIVVAPCDEGAVAAWLNDDDGGTGEADIKRHMSTININVLPQADAVGLKVFYDATVDGAELVEFGTQYATLGASDPVAAQQYAFGKFLSYGAMAADGSTGMGVYLSVMPK